MAKFTIFLTPARPFFYKNLLLTEGPQTAFFPLLSHSPPLHPISLFSAEPQNYSCGGGGFHQVWFSLLQGVGNLVARVPSGGQGWGNE